MLTGAVPTLKRPRGQSTLSERRGKLRVDTQALACPAASGQQGEQEAHCAPRSAMPRHTQAVLLGLPRSCLTDSSSNELSEGTGSRNRHVHVVLLWCGHTSLHPGSGARTLRENHPEGLFSWAWDQSARVVGNAGLHQGGSGSQPARVLSKQPLEAAGEVF